MPKTTLMVEDQIDGMVSSSPRGYKSDSVSQIITATPSQLLIAGTAGAFDHNTFGYPFWENNTIKANPALNYSNGNWNYTLRLDLNITRPAPSALAALLTLGSFLPGIGSAQTNATTLYMELRIGTTDVILADCKTIVSGTKPVCFNMPFWMGPNWVTSGATIWLSTNAGSITLNSKGVYVARD